MKANELRIGNLFNYHGQIVHVVLIDNLSAEFGYFVDSIGFRRSYKEDDCPQFIPLTEEWLLKFGFKIEPNERDDDDDRITLHVYRNRISVAEKNNMFYFYITIEDDTYYNFKWAELKYVHQLQNLYFALTGEELTLK